MINHPDQLAAIAARLRLGDDTIVGCCCRARKQLRLVESSVSIAREPNGDRPAWVLKHHRPLLVADFNLVFWWPDYDDFLAGARLRHLTWIELNDTRFPEGTKLEWLP